MTDRITLGTAPHEVTYATNYTASVKEANRRGFGMGLAPGQGASGYGSKISTDYMIRFKDDKPQRAYRVYLIQWSNVGTLYVIRKGEKLYIQEGKLEEALGR